MKKIVITGANGFVGKSITNYFQIHGVPYLAISHNQLSACTTQGDLQKKLMKELSEFGPDTFIHLAWRVEANRWEQAESQKDFISASLKFLGLLKDCGIKQTIGIGSCLEYEPSILPLDENSPENRGLEYTRNKLAMKDVFSAHAITHGYINSWARFFYIYGPNDVSDRLIPRVTRLSTQNEDILLKNPFIKLDYLNVQDAAEAVVKIALKRFSGTINVGSGIPITPREITDQIHHITNSNSRIIDLQDAGVTQRGYVSNNSLLCSLGWVPQISLEEGLRKSLSYK